MRATLLFLTLLSSLASAERTPACVGECLCVCVCGWVGVLVFVCVCVCVCGWVGKNSGRGRDVHTAAVTQRERRERREGGDL